MNLGGSGTDFTEEEVRGIIANHVHAGIGPFPPTGVGRAMGSGCREADSTGWSGAVPGQPASRPSGVFEGNEVGAIILCFWV